jgi:BirA family transcriptional regulator, biotin operon repressor / biotin---[acetyl-CoA-carboxylase] ligase
MRIKFERKLHFFDSLDSTNLKAREFIQSGATVGTTIVARTQTMGRGRQERTWHSPIGGLYFSTLLIPSKPARSTELAILAGAAVGQAITQLLPKGLNVTLKWPNDVLVGNRKVSGILSEAVGDETMGMCVVGIGVNVNTSFDELQAFAGNSFPATSLKVELPGGEFEDDLVLDMILTKLESLYLKYWDQGFEYVRQVWQDNCLMIGKQVQIENTGFLGHNDKAPVRPILGEFRGLDPNGAMVVKVAGGKDTAFYTGEITCFWP